ncbi:hypothetical protein DT076_16015 [Desertihabitans brevis]|uniref:Uncharacterized protein n=1 Tax=Desertihabitans brevis TaxID=2268447 RepID=A0A367YRB7_9ACTN|nr:hypothetical protein [Desertihabitans brevis]RCK68426.1 hypothetical protein DT076_16015 [Desertihabitans brevis]
MPGAASLPEDGLAELVLAHRRLGQRLSDLEHELDDALDPDDPATLHTYATARRRWRAALEHMAGVIRRLEGDLRR